MRIATFTIPVLLLLPVSGCGGDADTPAAVTESTPTTTTATSTTPEAKRPKDALGEAIKLPCEVPGFEEPKIAEVPDAGGWRLSYTNPEATRQPTAGAVTTFSLDERPPSSERVHYRHARKVVVSGHSVDLLELAAGFTAQWVTEKARYVIVGVGRGTAVIERVVGCAP